MLMQTLSFVKAQRHPPCPPPRKKTSGASSPFSGGKNHGGKASDLRERAQDLMGKEEDRGLPRLFCLCPTEKEKQLFFFTDKQWCKTLHI